MTFLIYTASFKTTQSINFSKWQLSIFLGGNQPLYLPSVMAYLTPLKGVPPFFFHQNEFKGCTLDYLDGLGHFLFGFGATGKNSRGVVAPLGGRGLRYLLL